MAFGVLIRLRELPMAGRWWGCSTTLLSGFRVAPPMLARAVLVRGHRRRAVPAEPACLCLGAGVVSAPLGQVTFGTVSPFLTRWEGASFHHSQVPVGQTLLRACAWQNC